VTGTDCLDDKTVVAFIAGQMTAFQRSVVTAHLDSCSACAELTVLAATDLVHRSAATGSAAAPFIGSLLPGSRVDRYQILGAVGRGGMGEVYAAYHPDLDRRIALKVVAESSEGSAERRARLLREARTIARLSHPNVVAVYDAGTVDDRVYIAMEFVEGETVDAWLRSKPRGWHEILNVFVAAGRGLAAAHAAGVIHRDFKPQNVMVGRDGTVRVMDFGLARFTEEPVEAGVPADEEPARPALPSTVTKTGALIGTIAYMAPEQFRRKPLDARADQFSFCVALHEAIYGQRPTLRHLAEQQARSDTAGADTAVGTRAASAPAWLRAVINRGLAEDRERRFPSMEALVAVVSRHTARVRRRTAALVVSVAGALVAVAAWRIGAARAISCVVPQARLAAVWPAGDEANARRQAVHRAVARRGAIGENGWQFVAKSLDDYTRKWSAIYVESCEATHVRGEQSADILDLRMNCLRESLDGVRALTDVLIRANEQTASSNVVSAAQDLPSLSRCEDVAALRAVIPLPRDEKTARAVEVLQSGLRDVNALEVLGSNRAALAKLRELLSEIEATGYRPIIAQALWLQGEVLYDSDPEQGEAIFEQALWAAEASRDDLTAAKATIALVHATGRAPDRAAESARWSRWANAILERLATPQPLLQAWLLHEQGYVANQSRHFEAAQRLIEQSLALKEAALGKDHVDVARTLAALAWAMTELGQPAQAVTLLNRAVDIVSFDPNSLQLAIARNNRGDALLALKRYPEAEADYAGALRVLRAQLGPEGYDTGQPLHGLGAARLAQGDAAGALSFLEPALKLKMKRDPDPVSVADTQFALARALVASGRDRQRAVALATSARQTYAGHNAPRREQDAAAWLANMRKN